jgi:hypothetical protein
LERAAIGHRAATGHRVIVEPVEPVGTLVEAVGEAAGDESAGEAAEGVDLLELLDPGGADDPGGLN